MAVYPGMIALPSDPTPALRPILDKLRGTEVPWEELVHAAIHLQGFALSQLHDHPVTFRGEGAVQTLNNADLVVQLEKMRANGCGPYNVQTDSIPWALIITTVARLLLEWLSN